MIVKYIEPIDKKRVKVTMEDGCVFPLYKGDIRKHCIEEDNDVPEEKYFYILKDIVEKRGKDRALYLLQSSDKTEKQLRDKLSGGYYPPEIINNIIEFLKGYNYIDDCNFAKNYIDIYLKNNSVFLVKNKLLLKGINKEIIDLAIDEYLEKTQYNPEDLIRRLLEQKHYKFENADFKEKNKIISFLLRKGFNYDEIMGVLKEN